MEDDDDLCDEEFLAQIDELSSVSFHPGNSREYHFPFTPYDIQLKFMDALYKTLDEGKLGIFESPTGTGKSLSIICGALTWLQDYENKRRIEAKELLNNGTPSLDSQDDDPMAWLHSDYKRQQEHLDRLEQVTEEQNLLNQRLDKILSIKARMERKDFSSRKGPEYGVKKRKEMLMEENDAELLEESSESQLEPDNFLLDEYHSDSESNSHQTQRTPFQSRTEIKTAPIRKIFYCSRTHSQLAQFRKELEKTHFGGLVTCVTVGSRLNYCINTSVRSLSNVNQINDRCLELQKKVSCGASKMVKGEGSRTVSRAQKNTKAAQCPYYKASDAMKELSEEILVMSHFDIEDVLNRGRRLCACPYYGTRLALKDAEVVLLSYQSLLHKSTREALGIDVRDHVIIIDEAHNLMDTVAQMNSCQVSGRQLAATLSQLSLYFRRYQNRLKAKNLFYVRQLLRVLQALLEVLGFTVTTSNEAPGNDPIQVEEKTSSSSSEEQIFTSTQFVLEANIGDINVFKLLNYIEQSQIHRELSGFTQYVHEVETKERIERDRRSVGGLLEQISKKSRKNYREEETSVLGDNRALTNSELTMTFLSPLVSVKSFLETLTNAPVDGRFLLNKASTLNESSIKFLLLNTGAYIGDVIKHARSIILAGGTMEPIQETLAMLQSQGVSSDRISLFSCSHVIKPNQIFPAVLTRSSTGQPFRFTFQTRSNVSLLKDAAHVLLSLCNAVPGGIVCFLTSYAQEARFVAYLKESGMWNKLIAIKEIFREPQKSAQVEYTIQQYCNAISKANCGNDFTRLNGLAIIGLRKGIAKTKNGSIGQSKKKDEGGQCSCGAMLFAVVGGKLSEGINFGDDLGRCVVILGMPYPNKNSVELKERMKYLDTQGKLSSNLSENSPRSGTLFVGQEFYENTCMKAVNQCIGRVIRHKDDFASILLLDERYSKAEIRQKLPKWISSQLKVFSDTNSYFQQLESFFADSKVL